MRLSASEIQQLAAYLDSSLQGQYLAKAIQVNEDTFSFSLSKSGRLLLCLSPGEPCVYLSEEPLEVVSLSTPLSATFRKEVSHACILEVKALNHDRILSFRLRTVNEIFQEVERTLVVELLPTRPNLILLNEQNKILSALRYSSLSDKRPLLKGLLYETPICNLKAEEETATFDVESYFATAQKQEETIAEKRKRNRFEPLLKLVKTKRKASERKIAAIEKDIKQAQFHLRDGEYGSFIYTDIASIHPETGFMDYYGEKVPLDPRKSASRNAEVFFSRAKKAKSTIAHGQENLSKAKEDWEKWQNLSSTIALCEEAALEKLAKEYGLEGKGEATIKSPLSDSAILPYEAKIGDTVFWFGKNAAQNDFLSFLAATKKNRLWFHPKDHRGSHLVLQKDDPSNLDISHACELALLASGMEDGEVQYCEHRNIRRGSVKGQAILKTYQSALIKRISPEVREAFAKAEKIKR